MALFVPASAERVILNGVLADFCFERPRGDTVPEFEKGIFSLGPTGLLRELVKSPWLPYRRCRRRLPGKRLPFEMARDDPVERLRARVEEEALRQYISVLAGKVDIQGADLNGEETPLVQQKAWVTRT